MNLRRCGLAAVVVVAVGGLEGGFDGLGASAGEVDAVEVAGGERRDLLCEADDGLRAVLEGVGVVDGAELGGDGVDDLLPSVADVDEHEAGDAVVSPVAVGVLDADAVGLRHDGNAVLGEFAPVLGWHPEVSECCFLKVVALAGGHYVLLEAAAGPPVLRKRITGCGLQAYGTTLNPGGSGARPVNANAACTPVFWRTA